MAGEQEFIIMSELIDKAPMVINRAGISLTVASSAFTFFEAHAAAIGVFCGIVINLIGMIWSGILKHRQTQEQIRLYRAQRLEELKAEMENKCRM